MCCGASTRVRRAGSAGSGPLCWLYPRWLRCAAGAAGQRTYVAVVILHESWRASAVRPSTREHPSLSTTSHLMPLPETLAACGLSRPPVHVLCIRLPYGRRLEMPEEPALELEVERIDLGRKSSASLGPSAHTQTTSTRRVHLDHRISVSNDAQGRPRSGAGRHANATTAPAARRGLAPPPSAAAPDAALRLVFKNETPESPRTGRRRGAGRRRRADGVREGAG